MTLILSDALKESEELSALVKTSPSPNGSGQRIGVGELERMGDVFRVVQRRVREVSWRHHASRAATASEEATGKSVEQLFDIRPPREEPTVLSAMQKVALVVGLLALGLGLAIAPVGTLVFISGSLAVFFIAANGMKLVLIHRALTNPRDVRVKVDNGARAPDEELPIYTILLPMYREASVLEQLISGIEDIDYPHHRLDVKLLLEEDDHETRDAISNYGLPNYCDVLIVPDVGPKGKPRACNYGLARARGKFLVIYDAEDRPERDQLRKSVKAFQEAPPEVVCLQAKLNYFNRTHNLLTRWFTAEYSVWFDQLLPGLQSMDVVVPLGGTSNHFITSRLWQIGGWDEHNVTEDAELGVRIYLRGWKTAILDTTTYEEATSSLHNWLRQRSRWVKGYMQTYLFYMRHPAALFKRMGAKSFVAFQLFFGAGTLCLLLNLVFWLMAGLWYASHLHVIQLAFPPAILYISTAALFVGNAACVLSVVGGAFGRRDYEDVKWAVLVPFYWVLMSLAACKALIQLFYKPSYWEKTDHGLCPFEIQHKERMEQDATRALLAAERQSTPV